MKIEPLHPAFVPKRLAADLLSTGKSPDGCPGLIVSTKHLLEQNGGVASSVNGMLAQSYPRQFPALFVTPATTSALFRYSQELSLLKSFASLVAEQVHPNLKLGIDAMWLIYGAAQLHDEWTRPDADHGACAFKLAGLGLSAVSFSGGLSPKLKLPDSWSNGINFCLKSGEAIYHGKTPPIHELMLATDKHMDIPLKILKLAGVSLDPQRVPNSTPARITLLGKGSEG